MGVSDGAFDLENMPLTVELQTIPDLDLKKPMTMLGKGTPQR